MGKIDYIRNNDDILNNDEYLRIIKYIDNIKNDVDFKYFFSKMDNNQRLKTYYLLYYFILFDKNYDVFNINKENWVRNYNCFCYCTRKLSENKNYFLYYKSTYNIIKNKTTLKQSLQNLI